MVVVVVVVVVMMMMVMVVVVVVVVVWSGSGTSSGTSSGSGSVIESGWRPVLGHRPLVAPRPLPRLGRYLDRPRPGRSLQHRPARGRGATKTRMDGRRLDGSPRRRGVYNGTGR